jgi:hypothetical protein
MRCDRPVYGTPKLFKKARGAVQAGKARPNRVEGLGCDRRRSDRVDGRYQGIFRHKTAPRIAKATKSDPTESIASSCKRLALTDEAGCGNWRECET